LVESGYGTGCDFFKETVHTGLGHGSIYIDLGSSICSSPGLLLGSDPDPEPNQKMILKLQILLIRNKSTTLVMTDLRALQHGRLPQAWTEIRPQVVFGPHIRS
jgi:hypothetical protein